MARYPSTGGGVLREILPETEVAGLTTLADQYPDITESDDLAAGLSVCDECRDQGAVRLRECLECREREGAPR